MKRAIVMTALLLIGCTALPTATQLVQIPIVTKCNPQTSISKIPEYPFDKAKKEMTLFEKFQLALSELSLIRGQNKELQAALIECTK